MHHIKLFIVDGKIVYIHHNTDNPNDDEPGNSVSAPNADKVRFKSRDGNFEIEFKTESPFISGNGGPGNPIIGTQGPFTPPEILKPIAVVKKKFKYTAKLGGIKDDPEIIIDDSGGSGGSKAKKKKKKKK